ncbi:thiamine diphosphokinase [uncultured Draconibacterium sp.]|uniref:thiamine diphosphokinase n=1 Tax=uncultured Draconibacterium sp. TaxID=1573823 RepID=UPI003217A580
MNQIKFKSNVVILCDGTFPSHPIPLSYLNNAEQIVCCDGAADKLIEYGLSPGYIVGDMDSVSEKTKTDFADRIIASTDQETNDQTKAVDFVSQKGYKSVVILGATGKREDHTIGNISLLLDYASQLDVVSISNSGYFQPVLKSQKFDSFKGQQVSIFSIGTPTEITSQNLKYPLNKSTLNSWWMGTLNECISNTFSLEFSNGRFIVFQKFER